MSRGCGIGDKTPLGRNNRHGRLSISCSSESIREKESIHTIFKLKSRVSLSRRVGYGGPTLVLLAPLVIKFATFLVFVSPSPLLAQRRHLGFRVTNLLSSPGTLSLEMALPWENITVGAVLGSVILNWAQSQWSKSALLGYFLGLWLVGFVLWGIWAVWVYPLFVSPLRHLPEPSDNHWLWGQFKKIIAEPSGRPMREWFVDI